jgi:hypothetical protein
MKWRIREYLISSAVSLAVLLLIALVAYVTKSSLGGLGILEAPGLLLAAVFFPQGGHSDFAYFYIGLALLIDALIWGWPVLWLWRLIIRAREKNAE